MTDSLEEWPGTGSDSAMAGLSQEEWPQAAVGIVHCTSIHSHAHAHMHNSRHMHTGICMQNSFTAFEPMQFLPRKLLSFRFGEVWRQGGLGGAINLELSDRI